MSVLAPAVLEQLARLGATIDPSSESVGLPPVLAALHAVRWPRGNGPFPFTHTGRREDLGLGENIGQIETRGHEGYLYGIAEDRDQHYYVIDEDDDASDPLVYRVDHSGYDLLANGSPLSQFLAALQPVAAVSELLTAMRDLGTEATLASVRADPATACKPFDQKSGFQPIHLAMVHQRPEVVTALLEAGARPDAPLRAAMKFARKYWGDSSWTDARFDAGETPLHLAVRERPKLQRLGPADVSIVRLLLAGGADPNAADAGGHTPLQRLVGASVDLTKSVEAMMKALLDAGANPDLFGSDTPSPLVLSFRPPERAKMLLEAGASPNTATVYFTGTVSGGPDRKLPGTAIHAAAARDEDALLKLMLDQYGGLPDVIASDGSKPLDNAYGATGFLLRTRLAKP